MFISNFKNNLKKNLEFSNLLPQLVLIFILILLIYFFIINTEINLKSRNLNFESSITELSLLAEIHPLFIFIN
jgi:hypothetical protein